MRSLFSTKRSEARGVLLEENRRSENYDAITVVIDQQREIPRGLSPFISEFLSPYSGFSATLIDYLEIHDLLNLCRAIAPHPTTRLRNLPVMLFSKVGPLQVAKGLRQRGPADWDLSRARNYVNISANRRYLDRQLELNTFSARLAVSKGAIISLDLIGLVGAFFPVFIMINNSSHNGQPLSGGTTALISLCVALIVVFLFHAAHTAEELVYLFRVKSQVKALRAQLSRGNFEDIGRQIDSPELAKLMEGSFLWCALCLASSIRSSMAKRTNYYISYLEELMRASPAELSVADAEPSVADAEPSVADAEPGSELRPNP